MPNIITAGCATAQIRARAGRFDCGNEALNKFFLQTARQHIQKGISRTFVLVDTSEPDTVFRVFTLSLCEVSSDKLLPNLAQKYPSTVPGVKLARLAVALDCQRQGIGEILMVDAMDKALVIASNAGVIGLFVDAKNENAKTYYARYGFVSLSNNPLEMFLPLSTIKHIFD